MADIKVLPKFDNQKSLLGLAYQYNKVVFSGSALGKKYSWHNLAKLLNYNQKHDLKFFQEIISMENQYDETPITGTTIPNQSEATESSGKNDKGPSQTDGSNDRSPGKVSNKPPQISDADYERSKESKGHSSKPDQQSHSDIDHHAFDTGDHSNRSNHKLTKIKEPEMNDQTERKRLQKKAWEISITGTSRSTDVSKEEMDSFKSTLDLAFDKRGNEYFHKTTGKLAFVEHPDKITAHAGLLNDDGSQNMIAHKAMAQAAKLKFGDVFRSTGNEDYVKASWLAAAMIGCNDIGLEPEPKDCETLLQMMREHADKYHRPPTIHPAIQKILAEHRASINFTKKHMRTASGGKSEAEEAAEEAQRIENISKYRADSIGNMVDRFRKNNDSEKPRHNYNREHLRK